MFNSDFDKFVEKLLVADSRPLWQTHSRTYVPSKFAVDVRMIRLILHYQY